MNTVKSLQIYIFNILKTCYNFILFLFEFKIKQLSGRISDKNNIQTIRNLKSHVYAGPSSSWNRQSAGRSDAGIETSWLSQQSRPPIIWSWQSFIAQPPSLSSTLTLFQPKGRLCMLAELTCLQQETVILSLEYFIYSTYNIISDHIICYHCTFVWNLTTNFALKQLHQILCFLYLTPCL